MKKPKLSPAEYRRKRSFERNRAFIYIVTTATPLDTPLWKVGYSAEPERRLKTMQVCSPVPLKLVGAIRAMSRLHARKIERKYHALLARAHGEWFYWSSELQFLIEKAKPLSQAEFVASDFRLAVERAKHDAWLLERTASTGFDQKDENQ